MQINAKITTHTLTAKLCLPTAEQTRKPYSGKYEIVPKTVSQELETQNKIMDKNIKVLAIPCLKVGNTSGTTIIIGDV